MWIVSRLTTAWHRRQRQTSTPFHPPPFFVASNARTLAATHNLAADLVHKRLWRRKDEVAEGKHAARFQDLTDPIAGKKGGRGKGGVRTWGF